VSLVIDACLLAEALLGSPRGQRAQDLTRGHTVHVPQLAHLEVVSVLRGLVRGGRVSAERADQALQDLRVFPARSWPHEALLGRVWELRHNLTAYDAAYVALAELVGATLVTGDARLVTAVRAHASCPVIEVV